MKKFNKNIYDLQKENESENTENEAIGDDNGKKI